MKSNNFSPDRHPALQDHFSQNEILELITRLVQCPSHEGVPYQETATAKVILEFFQNEGIQAELFPVEDGRCNVIARIQGSGGGRSLLLTGHTDTVPPYDMAGNPYETRILDDRIYGRGTVDMKGQLACMMVAMAALKRSGVTLAGDLIFAGVIDEEAKSLGTRALLDSGFTADAAIVGEPTNLSIANRHRGLEWLEFTFHGKTVHGGRQKEGINAIQKATRFIQVLEEHLIPDIEHRSHPVVGQSSMNYGLIRGGTQPSTVAGECILQIDRRWVPGEQYPEILSEYESILDQLHREDPQFQATMNVMEISVMDDRYVHESMYTDAGAEIVVTASQILQNITGTDSELITFPAWTDGGLLQSYGRIPTIILGPGEMESAHSAQEHMDLKELVPAVLLYAEIARSFCS